MRRARLSLTSVLFRTDLVSPMGRWCLAVAYTLSLSIGALAAGRGLADTVPRIGLLTYFDCGQEQAEFGSFFEGLEELGHKRGETFTIECQGGGSTYSGLTAAAQRLVEVPVDVIVTTSQPAGMAVYQVTKTVPIVSVVSGDPVSAGLVASLAKPGGNFTGVSYYATELTAKRLELLKEVIPSVAKIGVLSNPDVAYLPFEADTMRSAKKIGIDVALHHVSRPVDLDAAISEMRNEDVQAIFVLPDVMFASESGHIADLALQQRLPTMTWAPWFAQAGCLIAYSADYEDMTRRLAFYVDRILKGAKAGDLPLEQPTTFRLIINLKTAAALGLELPQTILMLADEVIE
jgi:putative tryptophan/tyrosine transport system substrate-binding protein